MIKADENIGAAGIIVVQDFMAELKARADEIARPSNPSRCSGPMAASSKGF